MPGATKTYVCSSNVKNLLCGPPSFPSNPLSMGKNGLRLNQKVLGSGEPPLVRAIEYTCEFVCPLNHVLKVVALCTVNGVVDG